MLLNKKGIEHYWYYGKINKEPTPQRRKEFEDLPGPYYIYSIQAQLKDHGPKVSVGFSDCDNDPGMDYVCWEDWDKTSVSIIDDIRHPEDAERYGMAINGRTDPDLIAILEMLGPSGVQAISKLYRPTVVELPDDLDFIIDEYGGWEWIAQNHRFLGR